MVGKVLLLVFGAFLSANLISGNSLVKRAVSSVKCTDLELTCSGKCVGASQFCDGTNDCPEGEDELESFCKADKCPENQFKCDNGNCIPADSACNSIKDCEDGSDEWATQCKVVGTCNDDEFLCKSGECISINKLCNGAFNCLDKSDESEIICKYSFCPSATSFKCLYGACIDKKAVCNSIQDCADNSDEDKTYCESKFRTSCEIPHIPNGRIVNTFDMATEKTGSFYNDFEAVKVQCDKNYFLLVVGQFEKSVFCNDGKWDNKGIWAKCQKLCPPSGISKWSTKPTCTRGGVNVPCTSNIVPGTAARIDCKLGYRLPNNHVYKDLICLESGAWNHEDFRCEPVCGIVTPQALPFVSKGHNASISEIPWQVGIFNSGKAICGGSIISERLVLSAAHCYFEETSTDVQKLNSDKFKVAAGKTFRDLNGVEALRFQILEVAQIITIDGYNGYVGYYVNDIAILVMKTYIEYQPHIAPVCLEFSEYANDRIPANGTLGLVAGWGLKSNGKTSDVLQKIKIPIVDFKTCKNKASMDYRAFVTSDKICAGYADGSGVCQGDSGGGLAISKNYAGVQVYFLRGIISNGKNTQGMCDLNFYAMFTNVLEYQTIIKQAFTDFPIN